MDTWKFSCLRFQYSENLSDFFFEFIPWELTISNVKSIKNNKYIILNKDLPILRNSHTIGKILAIKLEKENFFIDYNNIVLLDKNCRKIEEIKIDSNNIKLTIIK